MTTMHRAPTVRLSRSEAAAMLRAARAASSDDPDRRGEIIGWALSAMPSRAAARRLKIDFLHETGHYDAADALIARCLMQGRGRMAGPLMRLRLARSLHAQRRLDAAAREIQRVLDARPEHCGALALAARIARDRGRPVEAAELLIQACDHQPACDELRSQLVETLLEAELLEHASRELARMTSAPQLLTAKVLRGQHRALEAVDMLERALTSEAELPSRTAIMIELIGALDELGDSQRLNSFLRDERAIETPTLLRSAMAMLANGHAAHAARLCETASQQPTSRHQSLPLLLAAQVTQGDVEGASQTLERIGEFPKALPAEAMSAVWLAAIRGELLLGVGSAKSAGRDPSLILLQPMLRRSAEVLQTHLDAAATGAISADVSQLHEHLAACRSGLGEADHATGIGRTAPVRLAPHDRAGTRIARPNQAPLRRAA